MPGYREWAKVYFEREWSPLPLPDGAKFPPPSGWTGAVAPFPSAADIEAWIGVVGDANIALRLPVTVLGIDIDCYDGKQGAREFAALIEEFGPLPRAMRSTSRDDGMSGIRFYRVPSDWRPRRRMPEGIDLIHAGHRYAVVWPSRHPSGNVYQWLYEDGGRAPEPPYLEDVPDLPRPWLDGLGRIEEMPAEPEHDGVPWVEQRSRWDRERIETGRHNWLASYAGYVATLGLSRFEAVALVVAMAHRCVPGRGKTAGSLQSEAIRALDDFLSVESARPREREDEPTRWDSPELMAREFAPLRFLLAELLPVGLSIVAAAPKTGKTRLSMQLAISVALGVEAIGRPTGRAPVLYYALEDSARRVRSYLLQHPERERLALTPGALTIETVAVGRLGDGIEADISGWLSRNQGGLVIVDILQRIRGERAGGVNAYHSDYSELAPLQSLARYHDAGVLLVHHTNQLRDAPDPFEKISGTSGINGVVDTLLLLDRRRNDRYGKLTVAGRDVIEQEIALDFAGGWWAPTDMPVELLDLNPKVRALWLWLRDHEGAGIAELSRQYGAGEKGTWHILRNLEDAGLIDKIGGTGQGSLARYVVIPVGPVSEEVEEVL